MTVSASSYTPERIAGNGSTTSFPVSFKFFAGADLVVNLRDDTTGADTLQTITTHYTVTKNNALRPETGTVVFVTAPPSGKTVVIERQTPRTQTLDLTRGGPLDEDSLEWQLDRQTLADQEDAYDFGRALAKPATDAAGLDMTLPNSVDRASQYLAFDASGLPIAAAAPTSTTLVTPFMETVLDDANAATARATLGAQEAVLTNTGDMLYTSSGSTAARLAIGNAITFLGVSGGIPAWEEVPYPPFHISGFSASSTGTTTVSIGVGSANAHTTPGTTVNTKNAYAGSAFTKTVAAGTWTAGTGNRGIADGTTPAGDEWYAIFLLMKANSFADGADFDYAFDQSLTGAGVVANSEIATAGYNRFRLVGFVKIKTSSTSPDAFEYDADSGLYLFREPRPVSTATTDQAPLSLPAAARPPEGDVNVLLYADFTSNTADGAVQVRHPDATTSPNAAAADIDNLVRVESGGAVYSAQGGTIVRCNSSRQIDLDFAGTAPTEFTLALKGFYFRRSHR